MTWRISFIWPYTEALVNMPGMSAAYCNRAGACFHLADFEGSESDASSAIGLEPGYGKAFHRRAAARVKLGKTDEAMFDYDAAIAASSGRGLLRTSTRPTLNRRTVSARMSSIHPESESCSDLGRMLVLNDPPFWECKGRP